MIRSVWRVPSPVILRQRGYNTVISSYICCPNVLGRAVSTITSLIICIPLPCKIWIVHVSGRNYPHLVDPMNAQGWIIPPHSGLTLRMIELGHLQEYFGVVG